MICINNERIKICDRAVEECTDCVTGFRMRVPRLTDSELVDYAFRSTAQLHELSSIADVLIKLFENSKLGEANKRSLLCLLKRLSSLQSDMTHTGSTVASNLSLNEGSNATSERQELCLPRSFTSETC